MFVYYVKHDFQFNNNDYMHETMGIFVAFRSFYINTWLRSTSLQISVRYLVPHIVRFTFGRFTVQ